MRKRFNQEDTGMQGYGTISQPGPPGSLPNVPSAPPAFDAGQGYPPTASGGQGYPTKPQDYPPSVPGYPPSGPSYPSSGPGYPPSGPSYPSSGPGFPPGGPSYPSSGPGYPPGGPSYPSSGPGYPPSGPSYPSSGPGYPPSGPGYPPSGPGYPPSGPGYPPSGPSGSGHETGGQGFPQSPPGYQSDDGATQPYAPPPSGFLDPVPGYDSITFDDIPILPPSYDDAVRPAEPKDRKPLNGLPVISEQQARSALLELCTAKCCYGSTAARDMSITGMNSTSAFHYTLETFTEKRSTAWAQVPLSGCQVLDTAMNGPAPLPWDIQVFATEKFKTETKKLEVPHTACAKACHLCRGSGYVRCSSCHGHGSSRCTSCSGSGRRMVGNERRSCSSCSGSGHRRCFSCSGHGRVQCRTCRGCGQLKWFIQLTVIWTNNFEDYILERTAMPDELIRKASGQIAFQEEQPWLYPVNHCPEVSVNKASVQLIEKHRTAFPNQKQLLQRQVIRIVPVTEVQAQWKQKPFTFFVYGLEHLVHTEDYPQMCCCGCTIL